MTRFASCEDFPKRSIQFSRLKPMDKSVSIAETSTTSRKRRGKYCAAFGCNNSAYDANGIRTSYHFFEFPKDAHRRNRWCTLIKGRHGHDGFVVSTSTVLCHEHFSSRRYHEKTFWLLAFEGKVCAIFQLLLCLCYVYITTVQCAFLLLAISNYKSPRYFGIY